MRGIQKESCVFKYCLDLLWRHSPCISKRFTFISVRNCVWKTDSLEIVCPGFQRWCLRNHKKWNDGMVYKVFLIRYKGKGMTSWPVHSPWTRQGCHWIETTIHGMETNFMNHKEKTETNIFILENKVFWDRKEFCLWTSCLKASQSTLMLLRNV